MLKAKKWVFSFVALILACLMVIMSLNYFVDPYGYFACQNGEGYDLDYYDYLREQKAQHIKHFSDEYDAYLIGGSKAGAIRPEKLKELDGYNYYNCWLLSGNFPDYLAYVKYICENTKAKKILLQISTSELFELDRGDYGTIYEVPAVVSGESKWMETVSMLMKNPSVAWEEMTTEKKVNKNFKTGERNLENNYAFLYQWLKYDAWFRRFFHSTYPYYKYFDKEVEGIEGNKETCIDILKEIKSVCEENGVELQVYFASLFSAQMVQYECETFYDFMEEVVMLFDDVWCFNTYNDVALCPYNYYNPSHFFYEVGDLMIDTMAGKECPYKGFGQVLKRTNIGSVIEQRRASMKEWKAYYDTHYYPEYMSCNIRYKEHKTLPYTGWDSEANLVKNRKLTN